MAKSKKKVTKNVSILGTKELAKKIEELSPKLQTTSARILHQGGRRIAEDIKFSMALSPPSGRVYGTHTASSPGNPPRIDTDSLANAVKTKPEQFKQGNAETLVGVFKESGQAEKAIWMEFGTQKIDERPFARPAYLKNRREILVAIKTALSRELKKV